MIRLNIHQALKSKGIENTHKFLNQCQIPYHTASRLLNNNVESINFKYLEKICLHLHCTIDDLFVWIPDDNNKTATHHPLQKLVQKTTDLTITQKIKELPFDKIQQINNYIDGLNNSKQ
jgi:DNA-binding Xre family transcriptional regulator